MHSFLFLFADLIVKVCHLNVIAVVLLSLKVSGSLLFGRFLYLGIFMVTTCLLIEDLLDGENGDNI